MKRGALALFLITCMSGCGGSRGTESSGRTDPGSTTPGATTPTLPAAATAADLAFCISETNRYRAQAGRPALSKSATLESYAATSAQVDATSGVPHSHFGANGGGVAFAENELLAQPLTFLGGSVPNAMRQAIAAFYAEGPSGPHYQNLEGPYTQVGCGVSIANGLITFTQDFR